MHKYTTVDTIAKKLVGRLKLPSSTLPVVTPPVFGASNTFGQPTSITVDVDLIDTALNQKEYFVDLILAQIYKLPLSNNHPIIANIVEDLVIGELLQIHFVGQGISLGGDVSQLMTSTKSNALHLLQMLTAGHNVYVPGVQPPVNNPGFITPQPIVLPGEALVLINPYAVTRNYTFINKETEHRHNTEYSAWFNNRSSFDEDRDF